MSIDTGTFVARPAASTDGDVYLPSDGLSLARDNGVSWVPWGPLFPCVIPPTTGWSWVNQGTSTVTQTKDVIYMLGQAGAWSNLRLRVRNMPTPPWSVTALILQNSPGVSYTGTGICIRDSGTGRITTFGLRSTNTGTEQLRHENWTDHNNWSASPRSINHPAISLIGLKITDDNTNFEFFYSKDFQNWLSFNIVGRTSFLANPNQIGFHLSPDTAVDMVALTLYSWEES
jgi:hypothetical protein